MNFVKKHKLTPVVVWMTILLVVFIIHGEI